MNQSKEPKSVNTNRSIVWFRRDLRVQDNSALYQAASNSSRGVIGLFVATPQQWLEHDDAACKVKFWLENLRELSGSLAKLNIPLLWQRCNSYAQVSKVVLKIVKRHDCDAVYFNKEYEVNEVRRDECVADACQKKGIQTFSFHDRVIIPPREIATKDDRFYSVFTPYRKVWDSKAIEYTRKIPKPKKQHKIDIQPSPIPDSVSEFDVSGFRADLWGAGEGEAGKRLKNFAAKIRRYDLGRDLPGTNGTSLLSPYLAAGVISPRQCLSAALDLNDSRIVDGQGITTWISELAWRDFYTHVVVGFPQVSKHLPFKQKTTSIQWRNDTRDFEAWKTGNTGYPIVDAGMRQLNQTGWMHNRLRMVTAMFLTKHLMIDWRLGEKYFMQQLIDGDLAANNGGWQWSASTGTDAAPYFRIFNPFSQSKRFDAEGKFIKQLCPELAGVSTKQLHDASKLSAAREKLELSYPDFVVDHKFARERVLAAFKAI